MFASLEERWNKNVLYQLYFHYLKVLLYLSNIDPYHGIITWNQNLGHLNIFFSVQVKKG